MEYNQKAEGVGVDIFVERWYNNMNVNLNGNVCAENDNRRLQNSAIKHLMIQPIRVGCN